MVFFNHTQISASTTWTINHNLNNPLVGCDVYVHDNGVLEKILPLNVVTTSNNTLTINFSSARAGNARVVG
jgi:hypothetical protein